MRQSAKALESLVADGIFVRTDQLDAGGNPLCELASEYLEWEVRRWESWFATRWLPQHDAHHHERAVISTSVQMPTVHTISR